MADCRISTVAWLKVLKETQQALERVKAIKKKMEDDKAREAPMFMAGNDKPRVALSDSERFPLLKDLSFLSRLRQDTFAPKFNFQSGDRLQSHHIDQLNEYYRVLNNSHAACQEGTPPDWVLNFFERCRHSVPFFMDREGPFSTQPTMSRLDIRSVPWMFVSNYSNLDDLLVYKTSGTTGVAMDVIFDVVSQASSLVLLQYVLSSSNIQLARKPDDVAIAMICSQGKALTYASLSSYLQGAGILKINLNPSEWTDTRHRNYYLEKYNPKILTGDPFSFFSLLELKPRIRPEALISSAIRLTEGARKKLEDYFKCAVFDVYSMTECKLIAVEENGRHRAIRPDLYLEIFDKDRDVALAPGERGELVITGGNNPFLPLVRYRTGDHCSLKRENGTTWLLDLEARDPVVFYNFSGQFVNPVDISRRLSRHALAGFQLHQEANGNLRFTGWSNDETGENICTSLSDLFGQQRLDIKLHPLGDENPIKPISYSSEMK